MFSVFINPMWLVALFVLAPLLAIMAVNFGIIISSRVTDPRAAEQFGLADHPAADGAVHRRHGRVHHAHASTFWFASLLVLLAAGLLYLGVTLFQRETILTRWK